MFSPFGYCAICLHDLRLDTIVTVKEARQQLMICSEIEKATYVVHRSTDDFEVPLKSPSAYIARARAFAIAICTMDNSDAAQSSVKPI